MAIVSDLAALGTVFILLDPNTAVEAVPIAPGRHLVVQNGANNVDHRCPGNLVSNSYLKSLANTSIAIFVLMLWKWQRSKGGQPVVPFAKLDSY
jgi:hypothetical protein